MSVKAYQTGSHKTCKQMLYSTTYRVKIKAKFFRLSHDVVTCDVDRDVLTAYW